MRHLKIYILNWLATVLSICKQAVSEQDLCQFPLFVAFCDNPPTLQTDRQTNGRHAFSISETMHVAIKLLRKRFEATFQFVLIHWMLTNAYDADVEAAKTCSMKAGQWCGRAVTVHDVIACCGGSSSSSRLGQVVTAIFDRRRRRRLASFSQL